MSASEPELRQAVAGALDPATWSPFLRAAGLALEDVTATRVRGRMELGPEHHQPFGIVHGGVWASAAETAASFGACLAAAERGLTAVGVSNTTDFVRPHVTGPVEVVAEAVQQGRTQQLWTVAMTRSGDGKAVALSRVRLQNVAVLRG